VKEIYGKQDATAYNWSNCQLCN